VDFTIPDGNANCHQLYSPDPQYTPQQAYIGHWRNQMQDFVNTLESRLPPQWQGASLPSTYFEIGNEQNINDIAYFGRAGNYYPQLFQAAASGLYGALNAIHATTYRIITDGVVRPATTDALAPKKPTPSGKYVCGETNGPAAGQTTNHLVAVAAINDALQGNPAQNEPAVPYTQLGLGVHPYHYTTANTYYWRNYYTEYGLMTYVNGERRLQRNGWPGRCGDLGAMVRLWSDGSHFIGKHPLPVVFTEDNWSAQPLVALNPTNNQYCWDSTGCEGAYLVDLFTWLWDTHAAAKGAAQTATKQLRVMWYRGADKASSAIPGGLDLLGLYGAAGKGKSDFHLHDCRQERILNDLYTDDGSVAPPSTLPSGAAKGMPGYYYLLRDTPCYR
jgi:hypothetical protein